MLRVRTSMEHLNPVFQISLGNGDYQELAPQLPFFGKTVYYPDLGTVLDMGADLSIRLDNILFFLHILAYNEVSECHTHIRVSSIRHRYDDKIEQSRYLRENQKNTSQQFDMQVQVKKWSEQVIRKINCPLVAIASRFHPDSSLSAKSIGISIQFGSKLGVLVDDCIMAVICTL